MKSKPLKTFGSKGRNTRTYPEIDPDDERRPFSRMDDTGVGGDKRHTATGSATTPGENIDLEELRPPTDKVMVKENIYVDYSRA